MRIPVSSRWILLGAASLAACNLVAGLPDYEFGGAGGAAVSSSSGGGNGGATSSVGGGGQGGAGGVGGGPECSAPADCDSPGVCFSGTCTEVGLWNRMRSGPSEDFLTNLDVGGSGRVGVTGLQSGPAFFLDIFDGGGATVVAEEFPVTVIGGGSPAGIFVARDGFSPGSFTLAGGLASSEVDFGDGTNTGSLFLAELSSFGAAHVASTQTGGFATAIEFIEGTTDFIVAGGTPGPTTIAFDPESLDATGPTGFLARTTSGGQGAWVEPISVPAALVSATLLAVDGATLTVAGQSTTTDSVSFLGMPSTTTGRAMVGRATVDGSPQWVFQAFSSEMSRVTDLALTPTGDVVLVGLVEGMEDLRGTVLDAGSGTKPFLAILDGTGNTVTAATVFDGSLIDVRVAVDGTGNILLAGSGVGPLDFGGGDLAAGVEGSNDIYLAWLTPDGAHLASQRYGDASSQRVMDVEHDPMSGGFFLGGNFLGTVDFGVGESVTSMAAGDIFVSKLSPFPSD